MKEEILDEAREKMAQTIEALKRDFNRIRTGRASTALLDGIKVSCYESLMPMDQVATVSVPESRLITIKPWDQSIIGEIEKAILKSELGLTPVNDGKLIRLVIPRLSEERRTELVKAVGRRLEEAKVAIRNSRRDAIDDLREFQDEKMISEDEFYQGRDAIQELTDKFTEKVDEVGKRKEEEILEV